MKYKKIVLAGGNGYLGGILAGYYRNLANEVVILSRRPAPDAGNIRTVLWDGRTAGEWTQQLSGADLLINLCGKNVNCRYTEANRAQIILSRLISTRLLGKVIAEITDPPKLWINITSATIYRHAEDHAQDEYDGDIGHGFSIDVCKQWEGAFFQSTTPGTRKIALRMGIVMGSKDGAFPRLLNLVRCGLGGRQGSGQQYISWIHEQDAARCTEWLLCQAHLDGVINCVAPAAIKNQDFMKQLRRSYGVPFGIPAPAFLLEIAAFFIRTETELLLKSRWVSPKRLLDEGFKFTFPEAKYAINDILSIKI